MELIDGTKLVVKREEGTALGSTLKDALLKLQGIKDAVLQFEPGEYHFYPQYGRNGHFCISNHDNYGWEERSVAFWLEDFENLEIDGAGSRFIFHTEILPFYIGKCKGVSLKDFSVDYAFPAYSEAEIVSVEPQRMVIRIDPQKYKWEIKDNCLYFQGEHFRYPMHLWLEMDGVSGGPAYGTDDLYFCTPERESGLHPVIEEIDPDKICFTLKGEEHFFEGSRAGNKLVLRHHPRSHPAFYAADSEGVKLQNIAVHYAEGMGVLAERCKDIGLYQFNVLPDEKKGRCFSAAADGAHFVNCAGEVNLENCRFEKQMDDGVNVHGFYTPVIRQVGKRELLLGWGHPEQNGVRLARPGDQAAVMGAQTLFPVWKGRFEKVRVGEESVLAVFDRDLPDYLPENAVVENLTLSPNVTIKKCEFRKNRARGILLTSRKAFVEDCIFETAGAAVYMEGEACYWYESGATESVVLKGNRFLNCSYIPAWGEAPVTVCPKVEGNGKWYYHTELKLIENEFYCFDERVLYARRTGQILAMDNRYHRTKAYPGKEGIRFNVADCGICTQKSMLLL